MMNVCIKIRRLIFRGNFNFNTRFKTTVHEMIFQYFHYTRSISDSIFFFDRYTHLSWRRDVTPFLPHTTHVFVRGAYETHKATYIRVYHTRVHINTHMCIYVRTFTRLLRPALSPWKRKITGNAKSIVAILGIP